MIKLKSILNEATNNIKPADIIDIIRSNYSKYKNFGLRSLPKDVPVQVGDKLKDSNQWTWSGEGLKPKDADKNQGHKVMKFNVLQASVRAYQRNINTHSSYIKFREERAKLRDLGLKLDSLKLVSHLDQYAETGSQYVEVLKKIINGKK